MDAFVGDVEPAVEVVEVLSWDALDVPELMDESDAPRVGRDVPSTGAPAPAIPASWELDMLAATEPAEVAGTVSRVGSFRFATGPAAGVGLEKDLVRMAEDFSEAVRSETRTEMGGSRAGTSRASMRSIPDERSKAGGRDWTGRGPDQSSAMGERLPSDVTEHK
ncbi:hypothetical protein HK101_009928 [Irineochytrium annulatum]|nr:hypothetical protein HK101_009928 [Irineochytrium annulatum]